MSQQVTTYYLEMNSPDELRYKENPDPDLRVIECEIKQYQVNRFLYEFVGKAWAWYDRLSWVEEAWQQYAENDNLRTWVAYKSGSPAGYYELQYQAEDAIEIAYFGLAEKFIGQGYGGHLLSEAIKCAWDWRPKRVWVHTCTLDHSSALKNYQARGFKLYKQEVIP